MTNTTTQINIGQVAIGGGAPICLIAGPCVIESKEHTLEIARKLKTLTDRLGVPFIFKASYDKANRSSLTSYRGPGLVDGLAILTAVKEEVGCLVLSDVHRVEDIAEVAEVLDIIQIPAFLCRQTDMIVGCAATMKPVNIKKGQFMAPWDMGNVLTKARSTGNENIMVTERGVTFGYNNLVVDMRALIDMKRFGAPVVFDATHSVQLPGGAGDRSAGDRAYVPQLANAAAAVGIDALFLEVHETPEHAKCDAANSIYLDVLDGILDKVKRITDIVS